MRHDYLCNKCVAKAAKECGRELTDEEEMELVYEVQYGFDATKKQKKKAAKCPVCKSVDVRKVYNSLPEVRIKNSLPWWEFKKKNAAAMKREMTLHRLEQHDPYAHMRQSGEVDDIKDKLRKPKRPKPKYFT